MRKTKIVCTIGPASDSPETLRDLIRAGLDVARLNFSHGSHAEHGVRLSNLRSAAQELGKHVAIMLDTKGPEIRIGTFAEGPIELVPGNTFTLTTQNVPGTVDQVSVSYLRLPEDLAPLDRLLLDDGLLELVVLDTTRDSVVCKVVVGGILSNRKGINVPGKHINLPVLSPQDEADLRFGVEQGVDYIAASFMRNANDVYAVRRYIEGLGANIPIIAKIENKEGVDNLDAILKVADGLMVARGDMGVEFPAEEVPIIQKEMIRKANNAGKPVITATQMLDSMMRNPRPTRAEASDVANAIFDGTDAIMLSGETASGKYPLLSVQTMARLAERTEQVLKYGQTSPDACQVRTATVTDAISHATVQVATELAAAAIITPTQSGWTARMVSKHRPASPIIAITTNESVARRLNLLWGVAPLLGKAISTTDDLIEGSVQRALSAGLIMNGDLVVITAGIPVGVPGTTNVLKVHVVGDVVAKGTGIGAITAEGRVTVAKNATEANAKTQTGDVLVTFATDSDYIPAIERAAGLITEEGGLTSHGAIVGLNLNKATIVGVNGATSLFKDGQSVTLDGGRGLIYQGHARVR